MLKTVMIRSLYRSRLSPRVFTAELTRGLHCTGGSTSSDWLHSSCPSPCTSYERSSRNCAVPYNLVSCKHLLRSYNSSAKRYELHGDARIPTGNVHTPPQIVGPLPEAAYTLRSRVRLSLLNKKRLLRHQINSRRRAGNDRRAESFEDLFIHLRPADAYAAEQEVRSLLDFKKIDVDSWICAFNILGFCRSWHECMEETQKIHRGLHIGTGPFSDSMIFSRSILQFSLEKVKDAVEARSAIDVLHRRVRSGLPLKDAMECFRGLSLRIHKVIGAVHLSRHASDLALLIAANIFTKAEHDPYLSGMSIHEKHRLCCIFLDSAISHLMYGQDTRSEEGALRIIDFVSMSPIQRSLTYRLRLRLLGVVAKSKSDCPEELFQQEGSFINKPQSKHISASDNIQSNNLQSDPEEWVKIKGSKGPGRSFLDADQALRTVQTLVQHHEQEFTEPLTLACQNAIDILISRGSKSHVSSFLKLINAACRDGKLPNDFQTSSKYLKLVSLKNYSVIAWNVFDSLLRYQEDGNHIAPNDWASVIRLACTDPKVDTMKILHLVGLETQGEKQSSPVSNPQIYVMLIEGLASRPGREGLTAALRVWESVQRMGIKPSTQMVTAIAHVLVLLDRSEEGIKLLLDTIKRSEGTPDTLLYNATMKLSVRLQRFRLVYTLFKDLDKHRPMIHPNRNLTMMKSLLEAAKEASEAYLVHLNNDHHHHLRAEATWDRTPAAVQARDIFRHHLFSQHPELAYEVHPLEWSGKQTNSHASSENHQTFFQKQEKRFEKWIIGVSSHFQALYDPLMDQHHDGSSGTITEETATFLPHPKSRIITNFSAELFHEYLLLLPYASSSLSSTNPLNPKARSALMEQFEVLAWMRALDLKPLRQTLNLLCTHLDEVVPPISPSHNSASAAGPLHDYLVNWLGLEQVPTQAQVGEYVRHKEMTFSHP